MRMLKFFKTLCVTLCFVLSGGMLALSFGQPARAFAEESGGVYQKIDNYLHEAFARAHFPAASVTIVDKESVLFSETYGSCESTDTPFLLGSVSKSFTALAVMQLVERGKIELSDPLSRHLPQVTDGDKITILQLLGHTSGLGEHQNLTNCKIVGKQGVHAYANVNYSLLGKVVEAASGISYEEYVTQNIFKPLAMDHTAATYEEAQANGLIEGYENWFGVQTKTAHKFPKSDSAWITPAAGYLSSSTADLGRYLQMYLNGGNGIISQTSIDKMFYENVAVAADIPYKYGMGWNLIEEPLKEPALRHSGLVETGKSVIYILPQSGIGIAITVNANDFFVGEDMMDRIDWSVALMLMKDEPNEIGANEYLTRHLLYDLAYFAVLAISVLPLCLLPLFIKRMGKGKLWLKALLLVFLHAVLPVFILLFPLVFVATPLWVVMNFVPDLFLTLILSSCLLFLGGIVKSILLIKKK